MGGIMGDEEEDDNASGLDVMSEPDDMDHMVSRGCFK